MKKVLSVLLAVALTLSVCSAGILNAGAAGKKINEDSQVLWDYNAVSHVLSFSGSGPVPDFNSYEDSQGNKKLEYPWKDLAYTKVVFGDGITGIGNYALCYSEKLKEVSVPKTVTFLGDGIFYNCPELEKATVSAACSKISENMFSACSKLTKAEITSDTVTSVGKRAFYKCTRLSDVSLPDTVVRIETEAFSQCVGLKSITMPESLKEIGVSAFFCCEKLTGVSLKSNVKTVGKSAFESCLALTGVTFGYSDSGVAIGERAFGFKTSTKKITGFTVSAYNNNTDAKKYAQANGFDFINLGEYYSGSCGEKVVWNFERETGLLKLTGKGETSAFGPDNLPEYTRFKGKIKKIELDPGITALGAYAFYDFGPLELDISSCTALSGIGDYALYNTGPKTIILEKGITYLGEKAVGYYSDGKVSGDFRIDCYYGSTAHTFAGENGITYVLLDAPSECPDFDLGKELTYKIDTEKGIIYLYSEHVSAESIAAAVTSGIFSAVEVSSETAGTGTKLTLTCKEQVFEYVFVVPGDTDGNGIVNSADALAVLNHSVGKIMIEGRYKNAAADPDNNGTVNSADALLILQISVGISDIASLKSENKTPADDTGDGNSTGDNTEESSDNNTEPHALETNDDENGNDLHNEEPGTRTGTLPE